MGKYLFLKDCKKLEFVSADFFFPVKNVITYPIGQGKYIVNC